MWEGSDSAVFGATRAVNVPLLSNRIRLRFIFNYIKVWNLEKFLRRIFFFDLITYNHYIQALNELKISDELT